MTRARLVRLLVLLTAAASVFFLLILPAIRSGQVNEGPATSLARPDEVPNPALEGEAMPADYRQLLARDAIQPIYEPRFVENTQIGWPDDMLVLGVAIGEEAHAYPIGLLNRREMVIDRVGGVPILSTW